MGQDIQEEMVSVVKEIQTLPCGPASPAVLHVSSLTKMP